MHLAAGYHHGLVDLITVLNMLAFSKDENGDRAFHNRVSRCLTVFIFCFFFRSLYDRTVQAAHSDEVRKYHGFSVLQTRPHLHPEMSSTTGYRKCLLGVVAPRPTVTLLLDSEACHFVFAVIDLHRLFQLFQ